MKWSYLLLSGLGLWSIAGCRAPDATALKKIACEQAAVSLDISSVTQIDALRKALGLAPDVDPIGTCQALGVDMQPRKEAGAAGKAEGR